MGFCFSRNELSHAFILFREVDMVLEQTMSTSLQGSQLPPLQLWSTGKQQQPAAACTLPRARWDWVSAWEAQSCSSNVGRDGGGFLRWTTKQTASRLCVFCHVIRSRLLQLRVIKDDFIGPFRRSPPPTLQATTIKADDCSCCSSISFMTSTPVNVAFPHE